MHLVVNGRAHAIDAAPATPLLTVLRNDIGLNGPKYGCGLGECGACAVIIDDRAVRSCIVPVAAVTGHTVTTLEGLGTIDRPHPVQAAFIAENAAQCGYCLNGMIIATAALLAANPRPDEVDMREALRHHLCRCGAHVEILAAVRRAARAMGEGAERSGPAVDTTLTKDAVAPSPLGREGGRMPDEGR